jgi:S-adenosyl-L-methionine hydrolase (adenosine-forming)
MNRPVITLLTDFGTTDHYVAAMKGVILGICPDAQLADITHCIPPYQILDAAFTLSQAWPHFPAGSIHVIVVDPGVGSVRRALLTEAGGHIFVGPDNGLLTLVRKATGGLRAREITAERFFRHPVSRTFHGRDIFAPVAAHLAAGVSASEFGNEVCDPVMLPEGEPVEISPGVWVGSILHVDHFGNIVTNFASTLSSELVEAEFELSLSKYRIYRYYHDYSSAIAGELFLIEGSSGYLEISTSQAHAASQTGTLVGDKLTLRLGSLK